MVLKRQRGDAYNFGDNPDFEELVTKQLPKEDLEKAPTHTKDIKIWNSRLDPDKVWSPAILKTCLATDLCGIPQR